MVQLMFVRHRQWGQKELEWVLDVTSTKKGLPRALSAKKWLSEFQVWILHFTMEQNSDCNLLVHIAL
jgi:hypothetical protein